MNTLTIANASNEFNNTAIKQQSKITLLTVAKGFAAWWWFFSILSIYASYYTFMEVLNEGMPTAEPLAIIFVSFGLAFILEVFKHLAIMWVFAEQNETTQFLSYIILSTLVVASFAFHYKGVILAASSNSAVIVDEETSRQRLVEDRNHELKLQQGKINLEIAKVFNNKTTKDDLEATSTIASNNKYIQLITKPTNSIALSNARIKVHDKKQDDVNVALLMILCLAEAFILFSLLSKYIFKKNADKNLLVFNSVKEELSDMISSFWETKTKDFVKDSIQELNQLKAQNHPTPTTGINPSYPQHNPYLLAQTSSYLSGYPTLKQDYSKSPQPNGIYSANTTGKTPYLPSVYNPFTNQIHGRESENKPNKNLEEIKEILDENNDKWFYYKNWIVEEDSCLENSVSSRIGTSLENGFKHNQLEIKKTKTFELPIPINTDEYKNIWIIKIEEMNKQYSNKDFVEAETVEEGENKTTETVEPFNEKVPAIDLKVYTPNEQRLLKELFDNGAITIGQNLISRRVVLKEVGIMIKKHNLLSVLYEKLYEQGLINKQHINPNNKLFKYIALAELHHQTWQEKQ